MNSSNIFSNVLWYTRKLWKHLVFGTLHVNLHLEIKYFPYKIKQFTILSLFIFSNTISDNANTMFIFIFLQRWLVKQVSAANEVFLPDRQAALIHNIIPHPHTPSAFNCG